VKLKQRPADFRVRELAVHGYLSPAGPYRVYRVTKEKLTSREAAAAIAAEAGVAAAAVSMAGLKDRQGVSTQFMSVEGGRRVRLAARDLRVEEIGRAGEPFTSRWSRGNAFEIVVRDLERGELERLEESLSFVGEHGLPNYFDEQRFGNLRHRQGWVARQLMLGERERALWLLVAQPSPFDDEPSRHMKRALGLHWGDWETCRKIAKRFGRHRAVFERLIADPADFAGALGGVSAQVRLIHLYAWQSHLWNRAVSRLVTREFQASARVVVESAEGELACWRVPPGAAFGAEATFRLPGAGLDDVRDERQRALLADALAEHRLVPSRFRIEGLAGFVLKGEDRRLVLRPDKLRSSAPRAPRAGERGASVELCFELPRGAYATLVVRRLFARAARAARERSGAQTRAFRARG
jgi:tRNA pseudouridine13 synthase